ncbi:MAG TPA: hypothetical protein VHT92_03420 [Candidatus Cybelea sp.]|jgi:predicted ATPase|nr:hypothetical protein [Candidatus Cybelea sp.]
MLRPPTACYVRRVPVSDVLTTALLERLRRLNPAERTVLMRASVIGHRFRFAVLTATLALAEERVRAALETACALELIALETPPGDWYAFRHALIRDVAYSEFIGTRVRPIHRRIARALERCADDRGNALDDLAYHSWAAGDIARCLRYNELAGDRAVAVFAKEEAKKYYARALAFAVPDSRKYRRLSGKLAALGAEIHPSGDCSTDPVPPVRWTPG